VGGAKLLWGIIFFFEIDFHFPVCWALALEWQNQRFVFAFAAASWADRRATMIRREDGIEKRILLRCGRCKVVVGYYLDPQKDSLLNPVFAPDHRRPPVRDRSGQKERRMVRGGAVRDGEEEDEERPPAVYLLPGAVVETEKLGGEGLKYTVLFCSGVSPSVKNVDIHLYIRTCVDYP
jgi:hypothetical protein